MNHLTRSDYATALKLLAELQARSTDAASFAREGVLALTGFVASELTTLSVCDMRTGHRQVSALPGARLGSDAITSFDRHFFEHPLVRYHGVIGGRKVHRISDSLKLVDFRNTALYDEYYRSIGIQYVVAVPIHQDGRTLVSFVLNRAGLDFSERDRERLELLRPHLAYVYRQACVQTRMRRRDKSRGDAVTEPEMLPPDPFEVAPALTPREREVLAWLARGKTDAEIAALLSLSTRTVQKHLEHMYVKLGVETRTAAVMRGLGLRARP